MNKTQLHRWGMALIAGALLPSLSLGAAEPEDIIKYRQNSMKANGAHMAASSAIIKGKVPFKSQLIVHALALEQLNHDTASLFPKGSDFGKTKALDAVWEKRADFEKAAHNVSIKSKAFTRAAASRDPKTAEPAFKALGDACSSCHKKFRKKDD